MKTALAALALLLCLAAAGIAGDAGDDPEIVIRDAIAAWGAYSYFPVPVDIRSRRGADVNLVIEGDRGSSIATRRVRVPRGGTLRVEMYMPNRFFTIKADGGGTYEQRYMAYRPPFREMDGELLACLNSYLLRELEMLEESDKRANVSQSPLSQDELPTQWQAYVGLTSIIVVNAREARQIRPNQREALARWVRWFGGRLWLIGDDAEAAADGLGLSLKGRGGQTLGQGKVTAYKVGNGNVFVQKEADALVLMQSIPEPALTNPLVPYFQVRYGSSATPGIWLTEMLTGISTDVIIIALLLLGLIMGPVNYWFIHKRKNSLLFFVTTPIIAIVGALGIIAITFVSEGMDSGYTQYAVLARSEADGEAMLFDSRGVRSGFFVPTPTFSSDTLVIPIVNYGDGERRVTDFTDGVTLVSGWLKPRFTSGFMTVRPLVSRMEVLVEREGNDWFAVNNLGFQVTRVAAKAPDGTFGWAENIAPGERKVLRRDADDERLWSLYQRIRRMTDERPAFDGVTLVAQCEGLPYIEDGGMDSSLVSGEYYYLVVGGREGIGP